jgi:hypothetical protein
MQWKKYSIVRPLSQITFFASQHQIVLLFQLIKVMDFFLHKVDLARIQNIVVQTTKCENLMLCERMVYLGGA